MPLVVPKVSDVPSHHRRIKHDASLLRIATPLKEIMNVNATIYVYHMLISLLLCQKHKKLLGDVGSTFHFAEKRLA